MQSGIINVYKEAGFTSFDVCAKLRGMLHIKKIGHTGTLDPDATGVLPVCIGKATKVCGLLTDKDKVYKATMKLGMVTDTYDSSGQLIEEKPVLVSEQEVLDCIESFIGNINQVPPMYSALKVDGKKLYELARAGKEVERKARPVTIYKIEDIVIDLPNISFTVACSKGTYIRSLCHDIGQKLNCGACMTSLVRSQVDIFNIEDALTLDQIQAMVDSDRICEAIVPVDSLFSRYEALHVIDSDESNNLAINGAKLRYDNFVEKDSIQKDFFYRVYLNDGRFLGISKEVDSMIKLEKMFLE